VDGAAGEARDLARAVGAVERVEDGRARRPRVERGADADEEPRLLEQGEGEG
jgi:hypothetical protein